MNIGTGAHTYEWIDNWVRIPDTPTGKANGRTHGVVVTSAGNIMVFHIATQAVLILDPSGKLIGTWGNRFPGAHGMTLVNEGGTDYLWLVDCQTAEVVKTTLDGKTVQVLPHPAHPVYNTAWYIPTWVAVNEERFGGNGDIWVTDGYGTNYIHRYDRKGNYVGSINGAEGAAGKFACPHGISFDHRRGKPELYIADRGNRRLQVYDAEGRFLRVLGKEFLTSPDVCIPHGDSLIIPELCSRVTILDRNDQPAALLGENDIGCKLPGWPQVSPDQLKPGLFNSPHSAAADAHGNIFVVEWIVGGRITKLKKLS